MTDILFRAKRTDNGEWVEGYYVMRTLHMQKTASRNLITSHRIYTMVDGNLVFFCVDGKTVCPYTGEHDARGRKIFEGDIWQKMIDKDTAQRGVVHFENGGFVPFTSPIRGGTSTGSQVVIIGNKWDNRELIPDYTETEE